MAAVYTEQYPDWIDADKKQVFKPLFNQIVDFDKNLSNSISTASLRGIRQYTGRGIPSLHANNYMGDIDLNNQLGVDSSVMKVAFNLTASIIDTLTAKLASIQAVPQTVTEKGNVKGRQLADDMNFIIKGLFHKYDLTHLINLAFRDAMINRAGYLKVIKDDKEGNIKVDRVMVDEIIIDPADGYYNQPYKMIHRKAIPIHIMIKKYPKFKTQIEACKVQEVRQYNTRNFTPCITVAEAWCKNSYIEGGRHIIAIETADLVDEEWDKDYFPILKCSYSEPVIGWLGQSVVDELAPLQTEIDRIMVTIQAIMKIMSVPTWLLDTNANMNKAHRTNKIGLMWEGDFKSGVAPILHNGAAMPPELMTTLQFNVDSAYARVGLTPMDTQGQQKTGTGNQSAKALQTMTEIKSERWSLLQKIYERAHVDLAQIILDELAGTNLKLTAIDRYIGLKTVSTKKIPKTRDSYVLKIFPVSSLPDAIPDRIESVEKMMQLGVIPASVVPELFQMPDVDAIVAIKAAPRKLIEKKVEQMLDGGKYWNPEPYHDLDYALEYTQDQYNWGELNEIPDKTLSLLRRFINDIKTLISQRVAPIAPSPQQSSQIAPTQGVNNVGANQQPSQQPGSQPVPGTPAA